METAGATMVMEEPAVAETEVMGATVREVIVTGMEMNRLQIHFP